MKQFTLSLLNDQRPVLYFDDKPRKTALLDTGALFPVWIQDKQYLEKMGGVCVKDHVSFGGFGGEAEGYLYRLPSLTIGNLVYPNFPLIACDKIDLPYHMILSATMFRNLLYEIDDKHHHLNITVPDDESLIRNMIIEDANGVLHVLCHSEQT